MRETMEKTYIKFECRINSPQGDCVYSSEDENRINKWIIDERKDPNSNYRNIIFYIVELSIDETVIEVDTP